MTHLIADEKLGGVKREFIEVARDVKVGDYVLITRLRGKVAPLIRKVTRLSVFKGDFRVDGPVYGSNYVDVDFTEFTVLEPADIVVIDGTRYRLAGRRAEVGEKVLVPRDTIYFEGGTVFDVTDNDFVIPAAGNEEGDNVLDGRYYVLTPVDSEPAEPNPDIYDLLSNLATRLNTLEQSVATSVTSLERIVGELVRAKTPTDERFASLESQIRDTQRNVQTFAELAETTRLTKDDALQTTIEVLCAHIAKTGGGRV